MWNPSFSKTTSSSSSSSSETNNMSSDFGLRGPKTPWVCPNDRQLALRAKLRTGWSVKTSQFSTYPKPQPLSESEQQTIVSVIKKAEEMDLSEQKRVGKLVDRLESLKKLAAGNGTTECILCGDSFGLSVFGRNNYRCCDCKKAVCRKCVVELSGGSSSRSGGSSKDSSGVVRLCKICSENRELIKRSGAWFYKGVPKYILPEKKNHFGSSYENSSQTSSNYQEKRYMSRYLNSHLSNPPGNKRMGILWSRSLNSGRSQSEGDNDSSSGDDTTTGTGASSSASTSKSSSEKILARRLHSEGPGRRSTRSHGDSNSSSTHLLTASNHHHRFGGDDHLYEITESSNASSEFPEDNQPIYREKSVEKFDPCGSLDPLQAAFSDNNAKSSESSSNDCAGLSSASVGTTSTSQTSPSSSSVLHSPHGTIEVSLLYDVSHQALHCTVHKAKDLSPTDIDGLSDPFCLLKLVPSKFEGAHHRTKTVHKTLQPCFSETLTFYGLLQNDLAWQTLQINVMDDDRWGRDCLGSVQIPLHRIRPQQTRSFTLSLEKGRLNEEDWGRGRLLLSLCYITEKSLLLVGVIQAKDLLALDHNGTSDPFVKVRLLHDANLGDLSTQSHYINRKYKTSTKWKTLNPEFNEEFSLKVSILDLPRLALVISVWDKDLGKNNDYIGGIVLGYGSKGERLKHWSDMIKLPNIKHTKWHSLSPSELPAH